jgi:hypothetical protein
MGLEAAREFCRNGNRVRRPTLVTGTLPRCGHMPPHIALIIVLGLFVAGNTLLMVGAWW